MKLAYTEEVVTTSNTKLAATWLAFGKILRPHNPTFHAEEYLLSDLRAGKKDPRPPKKVFFNFEQDPGLAAIAQAFESREAERELAAFIAEKIAPALDGEALKKLHELVSQVSAQAAREALEARERLLDIIKAMPEEAKWMVIRRSKTSYIVCPKNSGPSVLAKLINKND